MKVGRVLSGGGTRDERLCDLSAARLTVYAASLDIA